MGWGMLAEPRLRPFVVEIRYRDLKKAEHLERFTLDVGQFDGLSRIGNDSEEDTAKALKEIEPRWVSQGLNPSYELVPLAPAASGRGERSAAISSSRSQPAGTCAHKRLGA